MKKELKVIGSAAIVVALGIWCMTFFVLIFNENIEIEKNAEVCNCELSTNKQL